MKDAIEIIHNEHRALAAVLHCLDHVVSDVRQGRAEPDFELFETIAEYVEIFPDRYHHPKEDEYLFKMLEKRDPDLREVIEQQRTEHARCDRATAELRSALDAYRKDPAAADRFFVAVEEFLEFERKHMSREERLILPRAREILTEDEQAKLHEAFTGHTDPLFGAAPSDRFRRLFSRIVAIAPQPYGFGRPQAAH